MKMMIIATIALAWFISSSFSTQQVSREDYHRICRGDWQKKLIEKQKRILSGNLDDGKYIITIPVLAGLADMIHGYIAGFVWSMFTDRAFIIHHIEDLDQNCQQRSIEFGYEPHLIDWSVQVPITNSVYKCMLPPYGGNSCPSDVTVDGKNNRLFQQINGGLHEMFYYQNISTFPSTTVAETTKNFIFASNRGITYHIFNNTFNGPELYSYGLTPETLFPCIFHLLFKPKPDVCNSACQITENKLRQIGSNSSNVLIGVHVRDETSSEAIEHFFCADRLIQHYKSINKVTRTLVHHLRFTNLLTHTHPLTHSLTHSPTHLLIPTHNQEVYILLVTASYPLQQNMMAKYGAHLLLPEGEPKKPEVVHSRQDGKSNDETCELSKNKDRRAMLDSARDMHLLSLAETQIVSRDSGFGIVGAMMRPKKNPIVYKMAVTNPPTLRMCDAFLGGDKLDVFADTWSGL